MRFFTPTIIVIIVFIFFSLALHTTSNAADSTAFATGNGQVVWQIDFADMPTTPRDFLKRNGFTLQRAFKDQRLVQLERSSQAMVIHTDTGAFGFAITDGFSPVDACSIEITWGISQYPGSANWQSGINKEAVMIYLFFGDPRPADRFFLPDSPEFIGLFLGRSEPLHTPFTGASYRDSGRYTCIGNPPPGQTIRSSFNFCETYQKWFDAPVVPPVTGIAIEMDTSGLSDGASSAFISRIALLQESSEG